MSDKTIIEINGVKLEVDLRSARRIDQIRIGDKVKVLTKQYDGHVVHPGVVVGFEPFAKLPTIVVAFMEKTWERVQVKFLHYNANSKDVEIVISADEDFSGERQDVLARFDREIASKHREIEAIEEQKRYFERNFRVYWDMVTLKEEHEDEV